jgi:phosphatidylethanolamine/phosphatidyl-N-methylethanolamine N-methyltransferase
MLERQPRRAPRSAHRGAFLKTWLRDPYHVASVVPSSRGIAKLMATGLGPGSRVIELGPGTGVITEQILESGVDPGDLFLIELNETFVGILKRRFPAVTVLHGDAESLLGHFGDLSGSVDFVISGVPLVWLKRSAKRRIIGQAFDLLSPEGRLHQVTFFGSAPISGRLLARLDLKSSLLGIVPLNFPPAFVHRVERRRRRVFA